MFVLFWRCFLSVSPVPAIARQHADREIQREKLRAFLTQRPETFWTQATLAEACGSSLGAIRTRLNELKRGGMTLENKYEDYRDADGIWHRGLKVWGWFPRPEEHLGRDPRFPMPTQQQELFR